MLGLGWFALRQAQEALKAGRLDEVQRVLSRPELRRHRKTLDLQHQLVRAYIERGERHLRRDDPSAAWAEVLRAEQVDAMDPAIAALRQTLIRLGVAEVRALLEAGKPGRALEVAAQLRERGVQQTELDALIEAARTWVRAEELADRGEFAQARLACAQMAGGVPGSTAVRQRFLDAVHEREQAFAGLVPPLLEAAEQARWRDVLPWCDKILAVAPQHAEARRLRGQAWRAMEPETVLSRPARTEPAVAPSSPGGARYLLWIDGVGGYLICLGNRVTFGQATPDAQVDVPLLADVSRLHASLTRDAEGYLLEAVRKVQVNGQEMNRALLQSGDRVTLGASCQFRFQVPVPVSATARLDLVSGHRLKLAVDGILLMADSLVLGPDERAHVVMPDLKQPVVLYRHKDGLGVRASGRLLINAQAHEEHAAVPAAATVVGEDFSFALEPAGRQMG